MLAEQFAALGDALVGDEQIEIVPERLGELRLRVDEVHDLDVGLELARCAVSKLAREMPRRAASGHMRSRQFLKSATAAENRIRLHQRMARRARLAAPLLALRRLRNRAGDDRASRRKAVVLRRCRAARQRRERNSAHKCLDES